jgi:hypothetical protein
MELNTLGAVVRFAISLEMQADSRYVEWELARASDSVSEARAAAQRNLRALERIRREQVNEMLLEALTGLDSDEYELEAGAAISASSLESGLERFYRAAAARLSIPEVARSFARLADQHARQREVWRAIEGAK